MSCSSFILGINTIYQIWQDLMNAPVRLCGRRKVCNIARGKSSCRSSASHSWVKWRIWKSCYHSQWKALAKTHHSLSARRSSVFLFYFFLATLCWNNLFFNYPRNCKLPELYKCWVGLLFPSGFLLRPSMTLSLSLSWCGWFPGFSVQAGLAKHVSNTHLL